MQFFQAMQCKGSPSPLKKDQVKTRLGHWLVVIHDEWNLLFLPDICCQCPNIYERESLFLDCANGARFT